MPKKLSMGRYPLAQSSRAIRMSLKLALVVLAMVGTFFMSLGKFTDSQDFKHFFDIGVLR